VLLAAMHSLSSAPTNPPAQVDVKNQRCAAALRCVLSLTLLGACTLDRTGRDASTLVAALGSDPAQLNPAITTNGSVHTAASLLYDGLVALDDSLRPTPGLAERWEVENGGAQYRFHLRQGVRWHDGVAFTSHDVKFTFEQLLLKYHARTRASMAPTFERIDAPDDSTVVFVFRRPYAPLLQQLDVSEAPILPEHLFAKGDPLHNPANTAPVGTGPFVFDTWVPGDHVTDDTGKVTMQCTEAMKGSALRFVDGISVELIQNGTLEPTEPWLSMPNTGKW